MCADDKLANKSNFYGHNSRVALYETFFCYQ